MCVYQITADAVLESMLRLMRVDGSTDYEKTCALARAEMIAQMEMEPEPETRPRRRTVTEDLMSKLTIGSHQKPKYDFKSTLLELQKVPCCL